MSAGGAQLRLAEPDTPAAATVPTPRPSSEHPPTPDPEPEPVGDRWRISGRPVPVLADYGPDDCTGEHGLCGVCSGRRCEQEPEPQPDDDQPALELDADEPEP